MQHTQEELLCYYGNLICHNTYVLKIQYTGYCDYMQSLQALPTYASS
jgi:hypothetical protein